MNDDRGIESTMFRERVSNACREVWQEGMPEYPAPLIPIHIEPQLAISINLREAVEVRVRHAYWELRRRLVGLGVDPDVGAFTLEPPQAAHDGAMVGALRWAAKEEAPMNGKTTVRLLGPDA